MGFKAAFSMFSALLMLAAVCGCLDDIDTSTMKEIDTAIKTKNPKVCDTLTLDSSKDTCYKKVAVGLKNPKICEGVKNPDESDFCYHEVAVATDSFWTCGSIKDTDQKAFCIASVGGTTMENAYEWANSTWSGIMK